MKILKKIMLSAIAVLALSLSFSCSNDSDSSSKDYIQFKYNGKTYTFDTGYQTSLTLDLTGYSGEGNTLKKIDLWLPVNATEGSHTIVHDLSNIETTYQADFTFMPEIENMDATSGTINITTHDSKKIEGTFNFSGEVDGETIEITEGKFSVSR